MNTNELLELATGMELNPFIDNDIVLIGNDELQDYKEFNPTVGDLILWLMDRGHLELGYKVEAFFFKEHDDYTGLSSKSGKSLKENLLSVVLQVIKAEKEE